MFDRKTLILNSHSRTTLSSCFGPLESAFVCLMENPNTPEDAAVFLHKQKKQRYWKYQTLKVKTLLSIFYYPICSIKICRETDFFFLIIKGFSFFFLNPCELQLLRRCDVRIVTFTGNTKLIAARQTASHLCKNTFNVCFYTNFNNPSPQSLLSVTAPPIKKKKQKTQLLVQGWFEGDVGGGRGVQGGYYPAATLWFMEIPDFPLKLRPQEVNDGVQDWGDLQNFRLFLLLLLIGREWSWTCCGLCQALFCHLILFKVTLRWFLNSWRSSHMKRSSCEEHEPDRTWCPSCQHTWHVAFVIHAWRRRKTRQSRRNNAPARKLDHLAAVRVQHNHCCC